MMAFGFGIASSWSCVFLRASRALQVNAVAARARYGAPADRLDPRGGQKQAWPTIHRWAYPAFTVYFERSKVIDVVVNKTGPDEIGPKPAAR